MSSDTLTDLLNRVSAIVKSGASTSALLSQETGIPQGKIYELVTLRRNRPNGARAIALHKWAERMTVRIANNPRKGVQRAYRKEFREISKRFPATGTKGD